MSHSNGFNSLEEDEVLRVQVTGGGSTQDMRYVASQQVTLENYARNTTSQSTSPGNRSTSSPSLNLHHPRPLPPLNPLTLTELSSNVMASTTVVDTEYSGAPPPAFTSSTSDSPFFRRLDSFRRSSTEFSIANFRASYSTTNVSGNSTNNAINPTTSNNTADYDSDLVGGNDAPLLDPFAVRPSTSSDSQALYGNEDIVKELRPDYARWFYKYEPDRSWTPFTGYDSIRMEQRYRKLLLEREVSGGGGYYSAATDNTATATNGYYYNNDHEQYHHQYHDFHQYHHPSNNDEQFLVNSDKHHEQYKYTNNDQYHSINHQGQINECIGALNNVGFESGHCDQEQISHQRPAYTDTEHLHHHSENPYYYHNYDDHAPPHPHHHHHQQQFNNDSHYVPHSFIRASNGGQGTSTAASESVPEGTKNSGSSPEQGPGRNGDDETCGENVIIVRGGLYEADLEAWTCVATYWPGDKCQITRGTWFYDGTWQPLSVDHADKLEEEHLGQFAGVSLSIFAQTNGPSQPESPTKKNRPVVHRVSFCEFHVDWTSPTEIHLFSKAASHKFMRSVGQRLGFQTWGHRLCRGYFKPASKEDRPSEISHLVFVVHGIGQKMDTGRIVRNCASFRECVSSLKAKCFPHLNETKQRAEFFPVEWRSAAKLDGDVVDAITPHKLLSLRQLLNATAMDIMYYTSPLYRTEIQNALRNELNRIYSNFVKRNPDFSGKVSVIAHSLGAVITYDIITGYMPQSDVPQCSHQVPSNGEVINGLFDDKNKVLAAGLLFQLEHFFCMGSPLSVFLALRWRDPSNPNYRSYILPKLLCKRLYNIFYSTDPVAYRVEPLLNKYYVHIAPIAIHTYGVLGRQKYDEMPRERINKETHFAKQPENAVQNQGQQNQGQQSFNVLYSQQQDTSSKSTPQRTINLKSPPTPTKESNWGWATLMKYIKSADPGNGGAEVSDGDLGSDLSPDGNSSPGREEGNSTPEDIANEIPNDIEYRMDYVLKESNFTSTYLAALTSHTSYWSSLDTAFFVLTKLYEDVLDLSPQNQNSAV